MTRRVRMAAMVMATVVAIGGVAAGAVAAADADLPSSSTTVTNTVVAATTAVEDTAQTVTDLDLPDGVAVAVLDLDDGDSVLVGSDEQFDTASIVKVDIIAALLWQTGGDLTEQQRTWAAAAIEYSDNDAATALFAQIGGAEGLDAFNAMIGLTDTTAGTDGAWGLTQTTVADQLRLLEVVFGSDSDVLDASSRDWLASLMGDVIDAQRFGVSAAADDPADAELKVGYLQRSATGLWDVTSIGRIESGGHTMLVAVLSHDQQTFASGVTIESAVTDAVAAVAD